METADLMAPKNRRGFDTLIDNLHDFNERMDP
jgi:hypothetical protein